MRRRRALQPMNAYLLRQKGRESLVDLDTAQQRPLTIEHDDGKVVPPGYPSMGCAKRRRQANSKDPIIQCLNLYYYP
ncbi:hypothetical protein BOTCAL_0081g00060 [Botryotinia calthae]|uniref:Uncharacterized protein n=1 Tax=Botryotinia calthae TaxID=38488 RepID=A0A4Y8D7U9_9HELO|nr:hypothetical protein BOTCAL_0081g00060 [Botryotinia calthae]